MTSVEISAELYERLSTIASKTSEFEGTDDLAEFALETVATDLEASTESDGPTDQAATDHDSATAAKSDGDSEANDDADDAVEERLGDLGYL